MARKTTALDLPALQAQANAYARSVAKTTPFNIPSTSDDADFGKCMDAILGALVQAWAAGWMARHEAK